MPSSEAPGLKIKRPWRHLAVYVFVALSWIAYLALTFSQPAETDSEIIKLTAWQLNLLRLTIAVPYLFIWLAAFHGALQIRTYQASLAEGRHRMAFRWIHLGLVWLAVGLLATTFVSSLGNLPAFETYAAQFRIFNNFLYVLFPLFGFSQLFIGSSGLAKESGVPLTAGAVVSAALVAAAIVTAQLYLVFTDPMRASTYHLSDPLLIATIVLPTAASIVLSVITAFNLRGFLRKSAAVIYEKSFPPLINGLALIMASTIILQLLLSLGQSRLLGLGIVGILVVVYVFLAVQAVGYLLVAKGTGRLAKLQRTLARYQADSPQA